MYRESIVSLIKWKEDKFRKPLIVRGARQVGKTWLLQEFGSISYTKFVYVNFEETTALKNIFSADFVLMPDNLSAVGVPQAEVACIDSRERHSAPNNRYWWVLCALTTRDDLIGTSNLVSV